MVNYVLRRILTALPVLLGVTVINFIIMRMAPGNPVDMLVSPKLPAAALEAKRIELGLNDPAYIQYWQWLKNLVLHGDLGYSLITYEPVGHMIMDRLGPTVLLMGTALVLGLAAAIPLGVLSATKQYSRLDYLASTGSFLGISVPNFFLGLGLIYVFAIQLKLLPSGGMTVLGGEGGAGDVLLHLILPVLVLTANVAGRNIRYVRSSMLEILGQDYLRTARAKGLREFLVVNRHAMRNALIPIVTVVGMEIPLLFGGAVVIEQIFSWPGIGQLTLSSIMSRDYSTLMGLNLVAAVVVVAANLATDVVYALVDPRINNSYQGDNGP
ncbi:MULTISPECIES: ABC transporter permease [unclassified Paenibacillus]|uniref:ABC transporter permease n=1 Tax=unclassified Paenibacillus TaxID=185978 RepID=UPI0009553394|nr:MULTISPECIES: ABC transporter permease [unclassified Paenibacillus]ASS67790.1 ABC transporter permease [Paenibacillus sp. RUD330]SIR60700.1 peptide/nickel transport system permease protein [Paenibacillus sp. RU4X]SIR69460.1 peptide/nickel transport system permease protein [Paenibacillus sp. RU4T]